MRGALWLLAIVVALASAPARASDAPEAWWVPDDAAAAAVVAALADVWPERAGALEVRVGHPPAGAPSIAWDGRILTVCDGAFIDRADADTAAIAVLLARTWAVRAEAPIDPAERYLPEAPIVLVEAPSPPEAPPVRARALRWSTGVGTRALTGQVRQIDAIRVVTTAAPVGRGGRALPVFAELSLAAGPDPGREAFERGAATEGAVARPWADRLAVGAAAGLWRRFGASPASVRILAGPELCWSGHWTYLDGRRVQAAGFVQVAGMGGAGLSLTVGRWSVGATGIARVLSADGPRADAGIETDVRYRWR